MYEHLLSKYGDETGVRIFFTTEPFANKAGYHNHFVIHIEKKIGDGTPDEVRNNEDVIRAYLGTGHSGP